MNLELIFLGLVGSAENTTTDSDSCLPPPFPESTDSQ